MRALAPTLTLLFVTGACGSTASTEPHSELAHQVHGRGDSRLFGAHTRRLALEVWPHLPRDENIVFSPVAASILLQSLAANDGLPPHVPPQRPGARSERRDLALATATRRQLLDWAVLPEPKIALQHRTFEDARELDEGGSDVRQARIEQWLSAPRARGTSLTISVPSTVTVTVTSLIVDVAWADRFDAVDTRPAPFRRLDGSIVEVPTMHGFIRPIARWVEGDAQCAAMALLSDIHDDEAHLVLTIVLPRDGVRLEELEARLDAASLTAWTARPPFEPLQDEVRLPRLGLRTTFDVCARVEALRPWCADGTRPERAAILHGEIDIVETGVHTRIPAMLVTTATAVSEEPPLRVDHPFLFLLHDLASGSILYMGRVVDPSRDPQPHYPRSLYDRLTGRDRARHPDR